MMRNSSYDQFFSASSVLFLLLFWGVTAARPTKDYAQQHAVREADRVLSLPGQPKVEFAHYSGYITVDELKGRALFYWFIEADSEPSKKPLVLWLNGGPGCSSIGAGASIELGPFLVNSNGTGLHLNKYAWNQEANMIFLESPIGVGFSYSNTSSDIDHLDDENTAENAYIFLLKWFERFPEYKSYEFYMAGESYAGHYVPQLAEVIFDRNKGASNDSHINMKGFMVGNALTDDYHDWVGMIDYAWTHAVISDQLYQKVKKTCDFTMYYWTDDCQTVVGEVLDEYFEIDIYNLYMPSCLDDSTKADLGAPFSQYTSQNNQASKRDQKQRPLIHRRIRSAGYDPCFENYPNIYFNRHDVQEAFHVHGIPHEWRLCSILQAYNSSAFTLLPTYRKLIDGGLRIWVYSGDIDGRVPVTSTRYTMNALGLPIREDWHSWYHQNQVGGHTIKYKGLTFVTIRGAGHLVPLNKPSEALMMFGFYLKGKPLPKKR